MPTYQYACTVASCGHQFDAVQAFSDNALTECPECSGRLRKVWGSIGVVFKGSGFYRNDSREGNKTKNGNGTSGEAKNGAKDSKDSSSGTKTSSDSSSSTSTSSSDSGTSTKPAAKPAGDSSSGSRRNPAAAS